MYRGNPFKRLISFAVSAGFFKTISCFFCGFLLGFFVTWAGVIILVTPERSLEYHVSQPDVTKLKYLEREILAMEEFSGVSRILCYFLVDPPKHKGAIHVFNTWGQRCDKIIFFSTGNDDRISTVLLNVTAGYDHLWEKSVAALKYLQKYHDDYDWFLKADDDTYIIVENLRYFLNDQSPEDPIYFGVKFKKHVKQGYMSGGGGYVFSRAALDRIVHSGFTQENQNLCPHRNKTGAEDLNIGICFESVGVVAGESLDHNGKPRFFAHGPTSLMYKVPIINRLHWYWKYIWHKHKIGPDCCSEHLISFHNIDPRMMWTLEFLLYRMKIHKDLRPSDRNFSTSTLSPEEKKTSTEIAPLIT